MKRMINTKTTRPMQEANATADGAVIRTKDGTTRITKDGTMTTTTTHGTMSTTTTHGTMSTTTYGTMTPTTHGEMTTTAMNGRMTTTTRATGETRTGRIIASTDPHEKGHGIDPTAGSVTAIILIRTAPPEITTTENVQEARMVHRGTVMISKIIGQAGMVVTRRLPMEGRGGPDLHQTVIMLTLRKNGVLHHRNMVNGGMCQQKEKWSGKLKIFRSGLYVNESFNILSSWYLLHTY
jgi:hypothetical protein